MAKLIFVDSNKSKYIHAHGDNIYIRQGSVIRRKRHSPPNEFRYNPIRSLFQRSNKRSHVNALTRSISDHFKALSQNQKNAWSTYATYFNQFKNGYQAFFSNNMRLLRSQFQGFNWINDITSPPVSVSTPTGLCAQFIASSSNYCITWATPVCNALFIQCFEWVPPGLQRSRAWPFRYVNTAISTDSSILVPTVFLNVGLNTTLSIRAINLRGEISPLSVIGSFIKASFQPGVYGCVYYGYAYYGPEA